MELLNEKVTHKSFGAGKIIGFDGKFIEIAFTNKTSKFIYPTAFETFIRLEDSAKQQTVLKIIATVKQAEIDKKLAEESSQKKAEETRRAVLAAKVPAAAKKSTCKAVMNARIEGKAMVFYVFQGDTFDRESRGGYIWAPTTNKAGNTVFHWDNLLKVREGDIIIHGCNASIVALSVAKGPCYDCKQPAELETEDLWEKDGRRVDCDYMLIRSPIKTASYRDQIIEYCKAPYSPFDKDGNGNMGYLYEISRGLAKVFISESAKYNNGLYSYGAIQNFLAE